MGFTIFRSFHIRKKRDVECLENFGVGDAPQGVLFIVQRTMSELNRELEENPETRSGNVEDDIVVEDVEVVRMETPPQNSSDQVPIEVMINEINRENILNGQTKNEQIQWLSGVGLIMKTLNKYLKNTLMSLLILSYHLPWYSTAIYGLITNSKCENATLLMMVNTSQYFTIVFDIFMPLLIKLKLDRLSE